MRARGERSHVSHDVYTWGEQGSAASWRWHLYYYYLCRLIAWLCCAVLRLVAVQHAGDMSNPCRPRKLAKRWAKRQTDEHCKQGEARKREELQQDSVVHWDRGARTIATRIGLF